MNVELKAGERLDDLQLSGLRLIQRPDAFRFGTDSVLLADFASPQRTDKAVDLGCGTGLELEEYFRLNPRASVVGIDLAPGMLGRLKSKLEGFDITTVLGSYFDEPFGEGVYDAAVSVESLHHYTKKAKTELYKKLKNMLDEGEARIAEITNAGEKDITDEVSE